jgi:hypothetical protein
MYTFVDFTSQITGRRGVPCPTNKGVSYTNLVCWLGRDLKNRLLLLLLFDLTYYRTSVIESFSSPHAPCSKGLSISLCILEVPFFSSHSQKIIFFHIYAPYKLDNMSIHRLHHYNPRTSSLVLKIKNCARFPCHITRSMILNLPYTRNVLTRPFSSI